MDAPAFIAWRKHLHLTVKAAAQALGCSSTTIDRYEDGRRIPRSIALACAAIEARTEPIGDAGEPVEREKPRQRLNITKRKARAPNRCTLILSGVRCDYPIEVGDTYYSIARGARDPSPMCAVCYMLNYREGSALFHVGS
jgi:transcriptional regulator with XRE-family HTH domain